MTVKLVTDWIVTRKERTIKSKIGGIDMIESEDGPVIIEANINPGLQGITKATGANIAKRIADFCHEEAKK